MTGTLIGGGALAQFLAACGAEEGNSSTTMVDGGVLKVAIQSAPDQLDPHKSGLSSAYHVFGLIHSNLVGMDPSGRVVPLLAERWTNPSPTRWIFQLRQGATFHDGAPVTAADVQFSLERILGRETASPWATGLSSVERVSARGTGEVQIDLTEGFAPLLTILSRNAQIVPRTHVESGDPARKPVGAGPFKFVEWVQGDHITLEPFADYFVADQPHVERVEIRFIPPSQASVQAVRSREVNFASTVPPQLLEPLRQDAKLEVSSSKLAGLPEMIGFNVTRAPMDNKLLRQAIAWSVDRQAVHDVAFFGVGQIGSQELGSASPWNDGQDPYKDGPDPERAKQLLAESGLKLPLKLNYLANSAMASQAKIGEILREALKPLGVELQIEVLESPAWLPRLVDKQYDIAQLYNETVIDPDQMYSTYLASTAPFNLFGYKNTDFDAAVAKARKEPDEATRKALYTEVRKFVFDDVPVFFVHYDMPAYLSSRDVLGVELRPTLNLALEHVGFAEGAKELAAN